MSTTLLLKRELVIAALVLFGILPMAKAQQAKPNIVILIGDDISYNDLGCAGNTVIKTPNIDELARNGVRFKNAYLTTSSCSPSRVSIITGRYPHNTGAAELHSVVPSNQVAFVKLLKQAGYYTAQAGKWHLGSSATQPGGVFLDAFDRTGGSVADSGGQGGELKWVEYLEQRPKDKPFFMWFAAHDAHRNWDKSPKPVMYKPEQVKVPANLYDSDITRRDIVNYYEEVSRFDYYVGRVVDELKREGVLNNTLIIVMADNGRPFPRNKTRMYDEGIKTPFVVHWPTGIKTKGAELAAMISVIDIAPTVMDVAGLPATEKLQGASFKKVFSNPSLAFRQYVFAEHNWHDFKAYERMVRNNRYVYIENGLPNQTNVGAIDVMGGGAGTELRKHYDSGKATELQSAIFKVPQPQAELYDYTADPQQLHNLIGVSKYKDTAQKLAKVLKQWRAETADDQPGNLTPDWYDRITNAPLNEKGTRGTMPGSKQNATEVNRHGPF